jgi:Zn-dependent protease
MAALFFSVVLHELGHALAARVFGVSTAHITLYPFGGIAALRSEPKRPSAEFWIAIAGPLVNGLLFGLGALAWLATGWIGFGIFAGLNLIMGVFNLIPAFPMDGGRVLRAALVPVLGWWRASRLAINVGRVFAIGFLAVGLFTVSFNLMLVGGFLLFATSMERRKLKIPRWARTKPALEPAYVPRWSVRPRDT